MDKIKIGLVDDHILFRDGLQRLINDFAEFKVSIEAENGMELELKLRETKIKPDIILLDINMKERDGYDTSKWLKENYPDIKVLALSMYESENSIIRMLRNGARGYILKDIRKQELHSALLSVAQKGYYYNDLITGNLIHALQFQENDKNHTTLQKIDTISPKELEFLKLNCSELTYKEIAEKMNVSPHTIDGYRDNLFEKLNIHSRVGLVLYAIRNRIVHVE